MKISPFIKNHQRYLPFLIIFFFVAVGACNSKRAGSLSISEELPVGANKESSIRLDVTQIDSIELIYTDDESLKRLIPEEDWQEIFNHLVKAEYDTVWNKDDIMIKMVAQDYSLFIDYKNRPEEKDIIPIWRNEGRVKFRTTWYILPEEEREPLYNKLETFR